MHTVDPRSVASVDEVAAGLRAHHYLADEGLATAAYLAFRLGRPLRPALAPGLGNTDLAWRLSARTDGMPMT